MFDKFALDTLYQYNGVRLLPSLNLQVRPENLIFIAIWILIFIAIWILLLYRYIGMSGQVNIFVIGTISTYVKGTILVHT